MIIPLYDDNPAELRPIVTVSLIVACVLVSLLLFLRPGGMDSAILRDYGLIPAALLRTDEVAMQWPEIPVEMTLVTSLFIHNSWSHLVVNVLYLWVFGNNIEDATGHVKFILFFLACGLAAALTHALLNSEIRSPMVGASGAISGVIGAYLILYPRARVLVLIRFVLRLPVYLPAMLVLGSWIIFQLVGASLADPAQGGVAFEAHIGGLVAGAMLIPVMKSKKHRLFGGSREKERVQSLGEF